MEPVYLTNRANEAWTLAEEAAKTFRNEFVMPEHILYACMKQKAFIEALCGCFCDTEKLSDDIRRYLLEETERLPPDMEYEPAPSFQLKEMIEGACRIAIDSESQKVDVPHFIRSMLQLKDSHAAYLLKEVAEDEIPEFMSDLIAEYDRESQFDQINMNAKDAGNARIIGWKNFVTCLNERLADHNPLIGREAELERTIQVLCRKDKNNPLHVGEPGVGKTSLAYGLAARIEAGQVPKRLKGNKIYELDLGSLLAGTQFRGELEKRLKGIIDEICKTGQSIVYIDDIHNLVGAGSNGESSMDASNLLKPYLEREDIRFIGATTYDDYNRYFSQNKGLVRRFQQIDILEPSEEEAVRIIEGLKQKYEDFHRVAYTDDAIPYAVKASAKYIRDRYLPDKAIDLIDEAGAYREIHPLAEEKQTVDKRLIAEILARICKTDSIVMKEDDTLCTLHDRISRKIFGQDEAVTQVVEAVQMAKAGLLDDNRPLANLLFVGPTGVGKTEVAKVLASELGIALLRFDMSEYTEKHTVAKLIGSPAGYVGYDDGGLLTDAIRKTPNCVLLLDEIEKAHPDIFNILLQVMDYGVLTDNKGRKSDFRHVILIMTSNAGAQYARAAVGFNSRVSAGEAMLSQVKKTFKPEFINRLTATVVFNDMNREMAALILDKKLNELNDKLSARHVTLQLTPEAHDWLLQKGFVPEYGAREMDRIITRCLKPLLTQEILFGCLKNGGKATVRLEKGCLAFSPDKN